MNCRSCGREVSKGTGEYHCWEYHQLMNISQHVWVLRIATDCGASFREASLDCRLASVIEELAEQSGRRPFQLTEFPFTRPVDWPATSEMKSFYAIVQPLCLPAPALTEDWFVGLTPSVGLR